MIPHPTGEFSFIAVDGMTELLHSMITAHLDLCVATDSLHADMRSAGLSTARVHDMDRIADWVESCLPDLRRRLGLASSLARQLPDGSSVRIDEEDLLTTEAAVERGRELAHILGEGTPEEFRTLRSEMAPHVDDPDVMESFVTELGAEKIEMLPRSIFESGVPDGRAHLAQISRGLATAISVPEPSSELLAVRQAFTDPPALTGVGWDRMALLQDGMFPPVWLAKVVRANALDEFVGHPGYPDENGSSKLRLSGSRFALAFSALRRNPVAAQRALHNLDFNVGDYVKQIDKLAGHNMYHPDVPGAFGLAVEAAAQVDVDLADRDRAAERFTYEFITASTDDVEIPAQMRESLERIAVSYVHEFAAGSFADSGFEAAGIEQKPALQPNDFPTGSGIEPSFFLEPSVTLRYVANFQRHPEGELGGPFADTMGAEFERLLDDAIVADQTDGGTRTADVMRLFGGLNNILYIARRDYAADYEAQQEELRSQVAMIFGGLLSIPSFNGVGHLLWGAVQNLAGHEADELAESDGGVTDAIDAQHGTAKQLLWYLIVDRLVEHGVGGDALSTAPDSLVDGGGLRPIGEILADADLRRAFYEWANENEALDDAAEAARSGWSDGAQSAGAAVSGAPMTKG